MSNVIQILIQAKDEATQKLKDVGAAARNAGNEAEQGGKGFGGLTGSFVAGNLIAQGVTSSLGFLKDQMKDVFTATSDHQREMAQLNQVIKSTGDMSGFTAEEATKLAESIQSTTPISRDAALAAENMLLTFTSIGKGVMPATTKAVTDMATAMNNGLTPNAMQLKDTAIQVGIAMNDPIKGISRLHRVGVQFTDTQKKLIKHFQDTGNIAGAQQVILKELSTEFGGRATAALGTYAGKQEQMKNAITDAKVEIGETVQKALVPFQAALANFVSGDRFKQYLKDVVQFTKDLINWVTEATKFYLKHKDVINEVAKILLVVGAAVYTVITAVKIWTAVQAAFDAVADANPWALAFMAIIAVITLVVMHWKQITALFKKGVDDVKKWFQEGIDFIKKHWDLALDLMLGPLGFFIDEIIKHWSSITQAVQAVFDAISGAVSDAMNFIWLNVIKPVVDVVSEAFNIWLTVVTYVFDVIRGLATVAWNYIYHNIIEPIIGFIEQRFNNLVTNITLAWNFIVDVATTAWNYLWNTVISPVINAIVAGANWLGGIIGGVFNWVAGVAQSAWNVVAGAARGAWNWVVGVWNGAVGWFNGIVNGITGAFNSVGSGIANAFSNAMGGAKNIVVGAVNWIIDKINSVIHTVNDTAGKLPGVPHISDIPRLYGGVQNWGGGLAVVGDINGRGGELIDLPKGSNVYTNAQSKQMVAGGQAQSGGDTHIHIEYNGRGQFSSDDAVDMARQITKALRAQGLNLNSMQSLR